MRGTNGIGILAAVAVAGGILLLLDVRNRPTPAGTQKKSSREEPTQRAAGFNLKGELEVVLDPATKQKVLKTKMSAGGPMHSSEVLRFEGQSWLRSENGAEVELSKSGWTFSDKLVQEIPFPSQATSTSKIVIRGKVFVYRRAEVKVLREILPDKSVKLYMNTGWVHFKLVTTPNGQRVQVTCKDLQSVHTHGMELVTSDKKQVAGRIMLTPGDQILARETLPYAGKDQGTEPITIRQLIPKREEPVELVLPLPPG